MSTLSSQADELRKTAEMAANLDGFERVSVPWMQNKLAPMLREASDTIDAMLDRLYELQHVSCDSRWHELFGTPERAARTLVDSCNDDYDYGCGGCPVARANCKCGDYDALLGWLKEDVE